MWTSSNIVNAFLRIVYTIIVKVIVEVWNGKIGQVDLACSKMCSYGVSIILNGYNIQCMNGW